MIINQNTSQSSGPFIIIPIGMVIGSLTLIDFSKIFTFGNLLPMLVLFLGGAAFVGILKNISNPSTWETLLLDDVLLFSNNNNRLEIPLKDVLHVRIDMGAEFRVLVFIMKGKEEKLIPFAYYSNLGARKFMKKVCLHRHLKLKIING